LSDLRVRNDLAVDEISMYLACWNSVERLIGDVVSLLPMPMTNILAECSGLGWGVYNQRKQFILRPRFREVGEGDEKIEQYRHRSFVYTDDKSDLDAWSAMSRAHIPRTPLPRSSASSYEN
jgi:hypothetical protein